MSARVSEDGESGQRAWTAAKEPSGWKHRDDESSLALSVSMSVAVLVIALVVTIDMRGSLDALDSVLVAITTAASVAVLALIYFLVGRAMRGAVASSRRYRRHAEAMMRAADGFAMQPAGVRGTIEALCRTARDAQCEVLVWDDAARTIWSPTTGERSALTVSAARRLLMRTTERHPLVIPDTDVQSVLPAAIAQRHGARALLLVPIHGEAGLLGLVLRRYTSTRKLYRAEESGLVAAIAAIGSVALDKANALDNERQQRRETELLLQSIDLVEGASGAPSDRLADAARQVTDAIRGTDCAVYGLVDGTYQPLCSHGIKHSRVMRDGGFSPRCELVALTSRLLGAPRVIEVAQYDHASFRRLNEMGFAGHVLVAPISGPDGLSGFVVASASRATLSERALVLVGAICRQVAQTLQQRRLGRVSLRRSRQLASTPKLTRALTGQREPDAVARIAARELHDGFGFSRVSIALAKAAENGAQKLEIVASNGALAQVATPLISTPPLDFTFESAEPYVACCGLNNPRARGDGLPDANAPVGCRTQLVVPIINSNRTCVGVVAVYERDPDAIAADDLHTVETIADQLASTLEQAQLFSTLERSYLKTVEALAAALEAKDAYTLDHAQSITEIAAAVGRRLGLSEAEIRELKLGALLHDIGKIGIPGGILNKEGPLTDAEYEVMKQHSEIGEQIIAPIEFLEPIRPLVLHEHERWDGAGYPYGLRGRDIPLGARIIFVCDSYHAMTSNRPYRQALPEDEARRRLLRSAGSQFDPDVVEAFFEVLADEDDATLAHL